MVSGNFYIDESADYAAEQGHKYLANTMRAAIRNYSLDKPGTFTTIKGYESYENMTMEPEAIEEYCQAFGHGAVTGTPQMILERMWELKQIYQPQGFFPHLYFGGMEVKAILHRLLRNYRWSVDPAYVAPLDNHSLPFPKDGLPIDLVRTGTA